MMKDWKMGGLLRGGVPVLACAVLMGFALVAVSATTVDAQDARVECRCVDADGNEIDDCSCFRTPRLDDLRGQIAFLGQFPPRLGITIDMRASDQAEGAVVSEVLEGGPAAEAGLEEGDVITRLDGVALNEPLGAEDERGLDVDGSAPAQRLLAVVRGLEPGQDVEVEYLRDGRLQTTTVQAGDFPFRWGPDAEGFGPSWDARELQGRLRDLAENRVWSFRSHRDGPSVAFRRGDSDDRLPGGGFGFLMGRDAFGLSLAEVNPELGEYFGTTAGVLVLEVENRNLGLEPGDVVLSIDGREVTTSDRMRRILGSYEQDEDIEMRIMRDGRETTVTGRRRY